MYSPRILCLLIIFFVFNSVSAQFNSDRRRIDSAERSYVFQVTDKSTWTHTKSFYYWFKSGRIHRTQGSYYGDLLHGNYKVVSPNRHLLEEGQFRKGVKTGRWRTWHENGYLKTVIKPKLILPGKSYREYDDEGNIIKSGSMRKDLFTGYVCERKGDSVQTVRYNKGKPIAELSKEK